MTDRKITLNRVKLMKQLRSISFLLISFFCFTGCNSSQGLAPPNIINAVISFDDTKIAAKEDEMYLDVNVIYRFTKEGDYVNSLHGKVIDRGSYSYRKLSNPNQGSIMFTYMLNNQNYIYEQTLFFGTLTTGTWKLTRTTDPNIKGEEEGTFKVISLPSKSS
ncbi:MAG: hypothetical protein S4CHLAM7_08330 [Chlamydiae bacterium]|nr:hypothetical protein [Chlamydiota bacterium]